jgi:type IV fimbrial biogenesis protein FimT
MRPQKGFTIIELMVTLAVLAVVVAIAAPSFSGLLRDSRNQAIRNEMASALQMARSEAVKRRTNVIICKRNEDNDDCDNGNDWSNGWLIKTSGGLVIKVWDAPNSVAVIGSAASITFESTGMASNAESITIKPTGGCTGQKQDSLAIKKTGSLSITQVDCQ